MSLRAKHSLGLPLGLLLATAALTPPALAQGASPISLFTPGSARTEPPPGEGVRGMRPETVGAVAYFTVSPQASRSLRSPKPGPTEMRIALPGGKDVTCSLQSDRASAGGVTFTGSVSDESLSSCDLNISDGKVSGLIDSDAGRFRIMPVGKGGTHAVVEVKTEAFPREEDHPAESPLPPAPDKRSMRDEPLCDVMPANGKPKKFGPLRILVLYTSNAASDTANIKGDIGVMMQRFNETLGLNRNFKVSAELAAALPVTYTESGDMETDLDRLSGKVDGYFEDIRQVRDKYKADLVHLLIRGSGDACGIGWLLDPKRPGSNDWGFSLSDRDCAMNNFSFIHEIGHNLGLNHDRAVVNNASSDDFNFGYVDIPHQIRTVMAYNDACSAEHVNCRRLPAYSTPNLYYKNLPLGLAADAQGGGDYNAELLCRNAAAAAKFAEMRAAGE